MKQYRIQLVIAFIVLVCGVSLMGLVYIVFNKPETVITPGVVVTSSSPVATPVQSVTTRTNYMTHPFVHHMPYVVPTAGYHDAPVAAMQSTGGIYTTSSARVQSVGGGGNGGYGIATTSHSSSSRGINQSGAATMPMTNFVALASSRSMARPEAQDAPQMASLAPRHAPGPPNIDTPPEEHQLVEHPIGDALLPLLLGALAYAGVMFLRRKRLGNVKL